MSAGFTLRIQYAKQGRLAYLSHLETIRSVERIVRRAGLPYAVTEGFSPHMKIAFGPALPVGAGGEGEYVDVRLNAYIPAQRALELLQSVSAPNLRPRSCVYIAQDADAITVEYPISEWEAVFSAGNVTPADARGEVERAFSRLLERGFIEVVRKRKKPKCVEFEGRLVSGPDMALEQGQLVVRFATRDTGQGALRPDRFIDAALEFCEHRPQMLSLTRIALQHDC